MPPGLSLDPNAPLSLASLLLNLGVGVLLSLALRWHFARFGSTLSNREEFAQVFPFVLLTTVLIITVVKSSLALSLGLVGALSIVRFRTPIKEPEELAYLFIAIAMGLGLGANQTVPTIIAGLGIMGVTAVFSRSRLQRDNKNLYLSIDWPGEGGEPPDRSLERLNEVIYKHATEADLRRFDLREQSIEATFLVDVLSVDKLSALSDDLRRTFPRIGVTFLDQSHLPSV